MQSYIVEEDRGSLTSHGFWILSLFCPTFFLSFPPCLSLSPLSTSLSLIATPFPPVMPEDIFKLPSLCVPIHSGQPDKQTPTRLLSVHLGWEHLEFPAPCSAALCGCQRRRSPPGAPQVGREPAFGCQGVRIPEDLGLARWDGFFLLRAGAVPQHRRAARIVAASVRSAARCSQAPQRF